MTVSMHRGQENRKSFMSGAKKNGYNIHVTEVVAKILGVEEYNQGWAKEDGK